MVPLKKDYDTYHFYQYTESSQRNVDQFTVTVEDMGEDCMYI